MIEIISFSLIFLMISFASIFLKDYKETIEEGKLENGNFLILGVIGVVINFFDALGLGSFAPATAILKSSKLCDEKSIPGTLNVATTIPVALEAIILLKIIKIDIPTTLEMVFFCTLGACLGAKYVSKLPEKKVQECIGTVLLVFAVVMMAALFKAIPLGGEAFALKDVQLIIGVIGSFLIGALTVIGIGPYAPFFALIFVLGMSAKAAFATMVVCCAFLQPISSSRFIREGAHNRRVSLPLNLFGILGVIAAAYVFKEIPPDMFKWMMVAIVVFSSVMMIKSARLKIGALSGPLISSITKDLEIKR